MTDSKVISRLTLAAVECAFGSLPNVPDPYLLDNAEWYKIKNGNYSQWVGREKLFERECSPDPNWHYWNVCVAASDQLLDSLSRRWIE